MIRRSTAALFTAAAILPAALGAHAADPVVPEPPRANCTKRLVDGEGDGYTNPTGAAPANQVKTNGLDIVGAYLRSTTDHVQVFLKIKDIPLTSAMPAHDLGYRYYISFKHGPQTFVAEAIHYKSEAATLFSGRVYPATTPAVAGTTAKVDPATDFVWFVMPKASLQAKAADTAVVDGGKIEAIYARTDWIYGTGDKSGALGDELKPTGDAATWTVGDDYCFGPPPAAVSDVTAAATQFGDASTLRATLLDEAGKPLPNEPVQFTVGTAAPVTGTTDATGVATAQYVADLAAGTHPVTASFLGSTTAGKASAAGTLTIASEVTKFAALAVKKTSATARSLTATLTDDDAKPLAGQRIAWYVNGKLVTTLVADAAGKSVFKSAKAGQTVQARYAGVAGKYAPAKSNAPKV